MPDNRGALRFQTAGQRPRRRTPRCRPRPESIRANAWQHVAVVVRRGRNETRLYVNGYLVAKASTGTAQFDDPKADLQIGRIPGARHFRASWRTSASTAGRSTKPKFRRWCSPASSSCRRRPETEAAT